MFKKIFQTRFLVLAIILFTIINAVVFVAMGIYTSVEGIIGFVKGELNSVSRPGLKILESLDIFLVALVFLIFAMGIGKLFLAFDQEDQKFKLPKWLDINSFTELKLLLWEAVLTTLVVYFVSDVVKQEGSYTWELLVLPASILLLSISIFILKKEKKPH